MLVKLKNYQLETLDKVLNYPMPFQKSRMKSRFVNLFKGARAELEKNRLEILESMAPKEKGKPKMKQVDGKLVYDLDLKALQKFNGEYSVLLLEEAIVEIPDILAIEVNEVIKCINASNVELDNRESTIAEEIITALTVALAPEKKAEKNEGKKAAKKKK